MPQLVGPTDLQSEIEEMLKALQDENSTGLRCYLSVFSIGNWKPAAMISLLFFLRTVGLEILATMFIRYQANIISPTVYGVIHVAALVSSKLLMDRIGRKTLFWLSGIGCIVTSFVRMLRDVNMNFAHKDNFMNHSVPILLSCLAFDSSWASSH